MKTSSVTTAGTAGAAICILPGKCVVRGGSTEVEEEEEQEGEAIKAGYDMIRWVRRKKLEAEKARVFPRPDQSPRLKRTAVSASYNDDGDVPATLIPVVPSDQSTEAASPSDGDDQCLSPQGPGERWKDGRQLGSRGADPSCHTMPLCDSHRMHLMVQLIGLRACSNCAIFWVPGAGCTDPQMYILNYRVYIRRIFLCKAGCS